MFSIFCFLASLHVSCILCCRSGFKVKYLTQFFYKMKSQSPTVPQNLLVLSQQPVHQEV